VPQVAIDGRLSYIQPMRPRALVESWVQAFNRADVDALAAFYADDATNHPVFEDGEWARP
jgi:ketosteroid isomerase-like protein